MAFFLYGQVDYLLGDVGAFFSPEERSMLLQKSLTLLQQ